MRLTKLELLRHWRDAYDLDVEITPDDTEHRDLSLDGARFQSATGYCRPEWPRLIADLLGDPTPYRPLGERAVVAKDARASVRSPQ